jgi:hypothetical protein
MTASTLARTPGAKPSARRRRFFLGGVVFYSRDPDLGVLLVPVGATLLLVSLYSIATALFETELWT